MIHRIYVEKKQGFDIESKALLENVKVNLHLENLDNIRAINRYDIEGLDASSYQKSKYTIFAEPPIDTVYDENIDLSGSKVFVIEYLPGQYDQRADSASQCLKLMDSSISATVRYAKVIALYGSISDEEFLRIKAYLINPVDSHEALLDKPETLQMDFTAPTDVERLTGFILQEDTELIQWKERLNLAMTLEDLSFIQRYFKETEQRDPTITELKVVDTYWSDHCRHTTFLTEIKEVAFEESPYGTMIQRAYEDYLSYRNELYGEESQERPMCLMDMAVIGAKLLTRRGLVHNLDQSEEINACSIKVKAYVDGKEEDWLVMFKNETHNHPTEVEPFGGAATCLGGAIRDPLSGRSYVYQAMRVTGSGDPRTAIEHTLPGKLPQSKITKGAAKGYSSYGNQIGLATGQVAEIYHPGYVAKRMEVGAVIGAAPAKNVRREVPVEGDCILLVGGRTGRDGCGGATGSSKEHTQDSILTCGAEVQKGNPPVERNLQRLFRRQEASALIKRCNDFGAGGVSVAIGELADSIEVNLDLVLKKYEGLDGTELAISESQERMAVVVSPQDCDLFIALAQEENLEAVSVAKVTNTGRFKMYWKDKCILDLSREFLNTNGVRQKTKVFVCGSGKTKLDGLNAGLLNSELRQNIDQNVGLASQEFQTTLKSYLSNLNCCSQKGLIENFDSTIGMGTVLMPLGGIYQRSPSPGMAAKLPITHGYTDSTSLMSYGFDPELSAENPYLGGFYAVIDSITKIAAMGGDYRGVRLSLQEYFERLTDEESWGKPFSALLGALNAQVSMGTPAIGGKDSMSGSFLDLKVPPTLISFAVSMADAELIISSDLKRNDSNLFLIAPELNEDGTIDINQYKKNLDVVYRLIKDRKILAANTVSTGGVPISLIKMAVGNGMGLELEESYLQEYGDKMFSPHYGALVVEISREERVEDLLRDANYIKIGRNIDSKDVMGIPLKEILEEWTEPLETVFPSVAAQENQSADYLGSQPIRQQQKVLARPRKPFVRYATPKVFIPAFPGTNCEMDSKRAFDQAGGDTKIQILRNLTVDALENSIDEMAKNIKESQILMIPGGFSGGDEPDGSAKFITAVLRNPKIKEAVTDLIEHRDGLILGICNGFQALIKLGLLPYGKIIDMDENSPTLTYNTIGRHVSCMVRTKIVSDLSPWLANARIGEIHTLPVSHGEGRFIANDSVMQELAEKGQIATRYVNVDGQPTMESPFNPNGSMMVIEGITSPDGRIFGKMAHSERIGYNLYKNIIGNFDQQLFKSGIEYFK